MIALYHTSINTPSGVFIAFPWSCDSSARYTTYLFLFSSVVSSYSGLFFILFCTVTFTRFTISHHTIPPIEVDYSDSHNFQLDMVHKQACMVVHMPCNCTVVFGRQLCNYSGSSANGFLGQQSYRS